MPKRPAKKNSNIGNLMAGENLLVRYLKTSTKRGVLLLATLNCIYKKKTREITEQYVMS